jgi:hypothetical protein
MQGCRKLIDVGRRQFLKGGGAVAAGAMGAPRRKLADAPAAARQLSFKSPEYSEGA